MSVINPTALSPYPKWNCIFLFIFLGVPAYHHAHHITWSVLWPKLIWVQRIFLIKHILVVVVITIDCLVKKEEDGKIKQKKPHTLCSSLKIVFVFNFYASLLFNLSVELDTKSLEVYRSENASSTIDTVRKHLSLNSYALSLFLKSQWCLKTLRNSTERPAEIKLERPTWHTGIHKANFISLQALRQCLELCARMLYSTRWEHAYDLNSKQA